MTSPKDLDDYRHRALVGNTAQSVRKYLVEIESNRANMRARWIWELLQNALDASVQHLATSVECSEQDVTFQHNGREFEYDEITHLIYHGSTKVEDEEALGQYGSGFLTTHLLSPQIDVSGRLEDNQSFRFSIRREISSPETLSDSMDKAWDAFKTSLHESLNSDDYTTRFRYPLADDAADVVVEGVSVLKRCAPFVVVINGRFSRIDIKSLGETSSFEVAKRTPLERDGLSHVTVSESQNGNSTEHRYILAEGKKSSVVIPLSQSEDGRQCLSIPDAPKLFLGFPLIGTEGFSFPAVINSFRFTPTENRDGVYLWKGGNKANIENQSVIEEAFALLTGLIDFAASSEWRSIYLSADIPTIRQQGWFNEEEIQKCLIEYLIEPIRQTPAVLCEFGSGAIMPEEAILPFAENDIASEALWDLLSDVKKFREKLPRRDEAAGWCNAIKSWASICECEPRNFGEAFDGRKLAELVDEQCDNLEELQDLLVDGICAVKWLNELYVFLRANDFGDEIHTRSFILDQGGYLDTLSNLYCDKDIDDELKDVADTLELEIRRAYLRDNRLTSLNGEPGAGNRENKDVVQDIIASLREMVDDKDLNDKFAKSSVRLFGWIVANQGWNYLGQYPAFCRTVNDREKEVLWLGQIGQDSSDIPLAPINAWPEDLRQFAELFPPTQILADEFYEASPDSNVWDLLTERDIVRTEVTTVSNAEVNFDVFLPHEPLNEDVEHRTLSPVAVSDVAFLQKDNIGTMERIRRSQRRARLFWRFVTEWLPTQDPEGLEIKQGLCGCGESHSYYQAAWLTPVANNKWIPIGNNSSAQATAQSLANLLRDSDALPIPDSDAVNGLLNAIRISRFDLTREAMYNDDETRDVVDNKLMNIMAVAQDDPARLDVVPQFLEHLKEDEGLVEYIEERRQRMHAVHKNQQLGSLVEDLVEKALKDKGFKVKRTHVGADLIIGSPPSQLDDVSEDDVAEFELLKNNRSWLVEVKATRSNDARMTPVQAQKAVDEDDGFLLCVVPVGPDAEPELEDVRSNMRFVADIGNRVYSLCNDLDDFEQQRSDITTNSGDGFQLVVMSGTTRIRVDKSVWENDGIRLSELSQRLK